jgi:hypothetical protein
MDDRLCVRLTAIDQRNLAVLQTALGRPWQRRGSITDAMRHALAVAAKAAVAEGKATGSLKDG